MTTAPTSDSHARGHRPPRFAATLALVGLACGTGGSSGPAEDGPTAEDRTTIRIERAGGQTGMEGLCSGPLVDALDFSIEDVRALIADGYETTLGYQPLYEAIDADTDSEVTRDMTVDVRFIGEPRTVLTCGGSLRQDVEVTLAFDDPPLDVIFEQTLSAHRADFAFLWADIDPAVADLLELRKRSPDEPVLPLTMAFTPAGVRGALQLGGSRDGGCGLAVFPAGQRCQPNMSEVDVEDAVDGVLPTELGELPIRWRDGADAMLSVAIEGEPKHACGELWGEPDGYRQIMFDVHVTTDDGRVDLVLPATSISVSDIVFTSSSWAVTASALFPQSALNGGEQTLDVPLPEKSLIGVYLGASVSPERGMRAQLWISSIEIDPDAPAVDAPIDATAPGRDLGCFGLLQTIAEASTDDSTQ